MRTPARILEPGHFARFRCIGADCEDTCCDGWAVPVDRAAYEKYRDCTDPEWRASFEKLVTIQPANPTDHDYARIRLETTTCPFLSDGLCSIQKSFGEDYLPATCASFPRVWNIVDQVLEASLDLGCPEAARVVLLGPEPMSFVEKPMDGRDLQMMSAGAVDTSCGGHHGKPYRHLLPSRAFAVRLLQNRALALWKRLLILGFFCDKLQEMGSSKDEPQIPGIIQAYDEAVLAGSFDAMLDGLSPHLSLRIETVVELIVARITSDFTNRRFLQCYKELMDGLHWGNDSTMDQITSRYGAVHARYVAPFLATHSYMLEHYLVNRVYRGLFPLGPQESTSTLRVQHAQRSIHDEFMLLAVHYAIIETLLVGVAGLYTNAFASEHVIRVIYSSTRTLEHSLTFSQRVIQVLEEKGLNSVQGAAVLIKG
ncbi:MAG TPA: flagellin lysine-N-methylase [Bryobacteraceae bacterium]|nr:flagellin lysine-N-methylase [Bryobacteraceae bacterium]